MVAAIARASDLLSAFLWVFRDTQPPNSLLSTRSRMRNRTSVLQLHMWNGRPIGSLLTAPFTSIIILTGDAVSPQLAIRESDSSGSDCTSVA